nr:zinc finger, CCHC-type [Tanacetum cinerariifolium]
MAGNTMKDMTANFGKLDKFKGHHFRRWQKKIHFLLTTLKMVYVLTTPMPELVEDATVKAIRIRAKWENDDYICRGHILNCMSDSLFDVYTNVESAKELWDSLESKYMAQDSSSKKFLVSNFNSYKMVDSRPVMEQYNELLRILRQNTQHGLKMDESIFVSSIIDKLTPFWKDFKHNLKHGKDDLSLVQLGSHLRIEESLRAQESDKGRDSGATTHVCKDRCWFKTFEPVEDGSVLYMGNEHVPLVHGKGSVALEFSSGKTVILFNVLYMPKLCKNLVSGHVLNKCEYKQVYESDKYILSKCGVFVGFGYYNNSMFMLNLDKVLDDSEFVYMSSFSTAVNTSLWHARLGHVHYKRMLKMSKDDLIPAIDENPKKCTTSLYTPQQNSMAERKNRSLKEMVNSMLSYSGFSEGFWGESMLTAYYLLIRVPNKRNKTTPYELWYKKRPKLSFLRVWSCRAVVRLPDPKKKTLGEKGIDCIFVGYAEHSKAYKFYVIEPNDSISINSIIESRDTIFDENHFFLIPKPKDIIPNMQESQMNDHTNDLSNEIPEPRKGKRVQKAKSYGSDFQLYLVDGLRDQVGSQYSYGYSIEEDPRTYNEAMQSRDAAFWKEAVDDKIGFRQKKGINYFDTYAPVARITTIRLLLALAAIHNIVIHQMDVKTSFLNGDLDEEVYMKQSEGFVMPGNEHKVSDVILGINIKRENNGIVITQSHYIEKTLKKFNREDCSPVSNRMDPVEKLKPNTRKPVDQLEYSKAIGCLMYAMTSTRPDIAYVVSRLSRGGAISWASKKQTCITSSTMEYGFVALAAAGKEAEWLRNLIREILIWPFDVIVLLRWLGHIVRYMMGSLDT